MSLGDLVEKQKQHESNVSRIKKIIDTLDQVYIFWIRQDTGIGLTDIKKILTEDLAFRQCLDDPRKFEREEVVREGSLCLMCVHNTFRGDFVDPEGCSLGGRWLVRGEQICPEPELGLTNKRAIKIVRDYYKIPDTNFKK